MNELLEARGIVKRYPGVVALSGASLVLRGGEIHGIVGENGAGKSTLMKIFGGVIQPDEGELLASGREVRFGSPKDSERAGIALIAQELALAGDLTVAQNIFLGREKRKGLAVDDAAMEKEAREILGRLGAAIAPSRPVSSLSVANAQLVEIAKALSIGARVLIMDEPTAALTSTEVSALFRVMRELAADGVAVVFISHRLEEVREICDRVTVFRDGAVTAHFEQFTPDDLISAMVGRAIDLSARPSATPSKEIGLRVESLATGEKGGERHGERTALGRQERGEQGSRNLNARAPSKASTRGSFRSLLHLHPRPSTIATGRAIGPISLEVRRGEIFGLAGLQGAGRTETLRAIAGADPSTSGHVYVAGKEIDNRTPAAAVAAGIGYLSEDRKRFGLLLDQTISENIALASLSKWRRGARLDDAAAARAAATAMDRLAIKAPGPQTRVQTLSGGNQQKVLLARWLARGLDVLLVDEPTRGIDVGAKEEIYALLEELAAAGLTIIVASSEIPELLRLAHRIGVMCEGRLAGTLTNTEATEENIMALATAFAGASSEAPAAGPMHDAGPATSSEPAVANQPADVASNPTSPKEAQ
ncbi:ribose transport system ATP-binding protein [Arcanobacterium wilhelmae]|uniref:Ribose transport system ATP-binding protein n=1 Tax=Arcanobacterium wilhelmae TaxID=1803177 RepID=A0ABT9NBG4_9ACTO|nr:sugar ABC transporter ATP-binding protein [Arcanobacterium wilhelmae]MDP9801052.1 ribose transport system ATP-binding protein [Arcanobacterium wilhelmae]WFN90409.1 sugar ABC transporter ATP-binding protein [Arcanobacterium wilhelmae]